jgi:hypothetical protein
MGGLVKEKINIPKDVLNYLEDAKLTSYRRVNWTPEMDEVIKLYYKELPLTKLAIALRKMCTYNRLSDDTVKRRIEILGLK